MSGLIERLEGAERGARELDGAVWYAVFEPDVDHGCLHVEMTEQGPREALTCELGSKWADDVGPYTTSLDAALALAERVLPGFRKFIEIIGDGRGSVCMFEASDPTPQRWHHAATAPLALCIAILRAHEASQ